METSHQRYRRYIRNAPRIMSELGEEYLRLQDDVRVLSARRPTAGMEWILRRAMSIKTRRMEEINVQLNFMVRQLAGVQPRQGYRNWQQVVFRQAAAVGRSYQRDRRYEIARPPMQYNPLHEIHWPHHLR